MGADLQEQEAWKNRQPESGIQTDVEVWTMDEHRLVKCWDVG